MSAIARPLLRAAAVAALVALAGCATRYDASGRAIYVWQFGQDTYRGIDYSNPRLPILPRQDPNFNLWEIPSPLQPRDLSEYSFLTPPVPHGTVVAIGDNAVCAAPREPNAPVVLAAAGAHARDRSRASAALR
ncbi:MAG: hypothetical protein IPM22_19425 [Betaproteobacteria bacterium]|nr:hypothetical protein [Betaproteobacteria bacterium]MCC7218574.1 hypothetical protein [Burkholderiales bacterium]